MKKEVLKNVPIPEEWHLKLKVLAERKGMKIKSLGLRFIQEGIKKNLNNK